MEAVGQDEAPQAPGAQVLQEAIQDEGTLPTLAAGARRKHIHWTHYRTNAATDRQPGEFTREEMWAHMVQCYKEAYPRDGKPLESILEFGLVVKELHAQSATSMMREEHHHIPTYCSEPHYWRKVKKISAEKYNVQLNAVAHDGYSTMYRYVRVASAHKPLSEIDTNPFFSAQHPQGEDLVKLLDTAAQTHAAREARAQAAEGDEADKVRSQFGIVFNWVVDRGLKGAAGAIQLQADAVSQLAEGKPKLMDFVNKHQTDLEDQIAFMWTLKTAPQRLERLRQSRPATLQHAACNGECQNSHKQCAQVYEHVLRCQSLNSPDFRHKIFRALSDGRVKGNAVMLIGPKNTGKTTVTTPAEKIFRCLPTPQSDSFCPLEKIRGYEVLLWQDVRFQPGHPNREERGLRCDEGTMNRLLEGLPTLIGVSKSTGSKDFVYEEDVAFIFTGPFRFTAFRNGFPDAFESEQLEARIQYVEFTRQAHALLKPLKDCGSCWARWVLHGELMWRSQQEEPLTEFLQNAESALWPTAAEKEQYTAHISNGLPQTFFRRRPAANTPVQAVGQPSTPAPPAGDDDPDVFWERLQTLMQWRADGRLTDTEFENAKKKLKL